MIDDLESKKRIYAHLRRQGKSIQDAADVADISPADRLRFEDVHLEWQGDLTFEERQLITERTAEGDFKYHSFEDRQLDLVDGHSRVKRMRDLYHSAGLPRRPMDSEIHDWLNYTPANSYLCRDPQCQRPHAAKVGDGHIRGSV